MYKQRPAFGFTLIELLIVVAIIAILAAIAVPNFLEAQTRAKISRVLSDMRTLKTGLEAYRVDNTSYPSYYENGRFGAPGATVSAVRVLSTPIAYLGSSKLPDPFADPGIANRDISIACGNKTDATGTKWPKDCYAFASWGPDKTDNTDIGQFPFGHTTVDVAKNVKWASIYDPTNGTVSDGDIEVGVPRVPKVWIVDTGADLPANQDPFSY